MKIFFTGVVLLLIGLFSHASHVKSEYHPSGDVSNLKRFALQDHAVAGSDAAIPDAAYNERLRLALVTELDANGFQFVPAANADFLVSCHTSNVAEANGQSDESGKGKAEHFLDRVTGVFSSGHKDQGSTVVEFFDLNNTLIWRGQLDGKVVMDKSGSELDNIRELIGQFLKDVGQKHSS
jgi:hypothetical protein